MKDVKAILILMCQPHKTEEVILYAYWIEESLVCTKIMFMIIQFIV